jgi:hypothetical protein
LFIPPVAPGRGHFEAVGVPPFGSRGLTPGGVNIAGLGGLGAGATAALPASTAITAATAASWNAASGADEAAAPDDSSLTTTGTTSMDFASSALAGFFHDGGPFDADEPPPALAGAGRKEVRMRSI